MSGLCLSLVKGFLRLSVEKEDFYSILQVDPSATQDEIRSAFKRLAFLYHPDRWDHPQATERMQRLNQAYEVLGDPEKRVQYDQERLPEPPRTIEVNPEEVTQPSSVSSREPDGQTRPVRVYDPEQEARKRAWMQSHLAFLLHILFLALLLFSLSLLTGQVNMLALLLLVVLSVSMIFTIVRNIRNPLV